MDLYGKSRHDLDGMCLLFVQSASLPLFNSEGAKRAYVIITPDPERRPREADWVYNGVDYAIVHV